MSTPVIDLVVATKVNIRCYRGDTFNFILKLFDDLLKTQPTNLVGSVLKLDVKDIKSNTVLLTFQSPGGGITIQNTNEAAFLKTASEMSAIAAGEYKYDLKRTYVDGVTVKRQSYGIFEIMQNIT